MQNNNNPAVFELEYNTERELLKIPEYGRHIHKLIDNVKAIESREERNKATKQVIKIMGEMNPHLRDVPDFQHMLWDQLFFMADFDLDVDSPYPIPTKENAYIPQVKLDYPQQYPKYRFYGNNITNMIEEAMKWDEGEKKDALIVVIANHMKKSYLSWNKETVTDEVIFEHLLELSNGKINLLKKDEELSTSSDLLKINKKQNNRFNQNNKPQHNKPRHYKNKNRK